MLEDSLLKDVVENHLFLDKEYRINRMNDGKERWVHGRGKLEFNKDGKLVRLLGTIQDITNRKNIENILLQQQQSLKKNNSEIKKQNNLLIESEQRFINLFENSPVSLWEEDISDVIELLQNKAKEVENLKLYLDQNPNFVAKCASKVKVLNVNKSTLKLLGAKSNAQLMRSLATFFTPKSFEAFKEELLAIAANKKTFKCYTEFLRSNGEVIYVYLEYVKIDDTRIIITLSDITELKNAKEKAEEGNRLKTEFINNMSHEIRTPMNGILGFSEFLADSNISDEKRVNFVKIIQNSGHQLLKIIDDILEISKLETKQIKIFEEPFNLNDLLFELFSIFDSKAKENNTPLYLEKGLSNNKSIIKSDKSKLYKILSNLLENALKFTNVGHIEFGYILRQENKQDLLEIYVKDTGRGIKKEDQQVIFERFVQSEKDSTNKIEGLGLGLSIAKENTELLGGTITLESAKGKGTTFFVRIPYNPVVDVEDIAEQVTDKLNILIVEDEEVNYLYLTTIIEVVLKINCTILHAKNGLEAIHFCENNPKIDLILMDLKMPVMDGFIATKKIKELNSTIPILAQTAYSTKKEKEKAKQAGCDDFISKPITKEALLDKLKTFIPNL